MKIELDTELGGYSISFENGMMEMLESAIRYDPLGKTPAEQYWPEMQNLKTWDAVSRQCRSPWEAGIQTIRQAAEKIADAHLPQPVSIRRKRRWSENDGEVDVDRALSGEPDCLRELHRIRRPRTQNVSIMCDVSANARVTNSQLFWRSAAVIAAIDYLEESGYRCEVWGYDMGTNCYTGTTNHRSFIAFRAKDSGDPLDVDAISKCMAPWFFRTVLFANYNAAGMPVSGGKGRHTVENRERWFSRHCNIDTSNETIWMPSVISEQQSTQAVKTILESIQQPAA